MPYRISICVQRGTLFIFQPELPQKPFFVTSELMSEYTYSRPMPKLPACRRSPSLATPRSRDSHAECDEPSSTPKRVDPKRAVRLSARAGMASLRPMVTRDCGAGGNQCTTKFRATGIHPCWRAIESGLRMWALAPPVSRGSMPLPLLDACGADR